VGHSKGSATAGVDWILLLFVGHLLLEVLGSKFRMLKPALFFVVPGLLAVTALASLLVVLSLFDLVVSGVRSEGFDFRTIFLSCTNQAINRIKGFLKRKWLLTLGAIYNINHALIPNRVLNRGFYKEGPATQ
jgi:hypothetical protein